jgi:hypothetical protein
MTIPPAPPAPTATPLSAAYATVSSALGYLRITEEAPADGAAGDGWLRGSDLVEDEAVLDAVIAASAEETLAAYGQQGRDDVEAGLALHQYAWPVTLLFSMPHFLLRRVPRFGPGDVAFHLGEGRITVRTDGFSCLPDDPAAGLPQARTVDGEEALRAELRAAVAEHLGPVLEAFRPRMRRRHRGMWGMATDELAGGLWHLGKLLGEEQRARHEAELLLPGRTAPYAGGAGFRTLTGARGERLPTRDRVSCCLFYTLRPEDTCLTCPRTCDSERIRRATEAGQLGQLGQ